MKGDFVYLLSYYGLVLRGAPAKNGKKPPFFFFFVLYIEAQIALLLVNICGKKNPAKATLI